MLVWKFHLGNHETISSKKLKVLGSRVESLVRSHNDALFKLSGIFLMFMHMKSGITRKDGMELKYKL